MSGSCLDCPFRRDSEVKLPDDADPSEFFYRNVIQRDDYGDHQPYTCPESQEVCYGQLVCMKNFEIVYDSLSNIEELIQGIEVDRETYFDGAYQFTHYHAGGPLYGVEWFVENYGRGNKRARDTVPVILKR